MIRATGAKLRMLASDTASLAVFLGVVCEGDEDDCGVEWDDMIWLQGGRFPSTARRRQACRGKVDL